MAFWNKPAASGDAIWEWVDKPPADSPKMVILAGSPPNLAILAFTHCNAACWSIKP
jgi:hypothetical protein